MGTGVLRTSGAWFEAIIYVPTNSPMLVIFTGFGANLGMICILASLCPAVKQNLSLLRSSNDPAQGAGLGFRVCGLGFGFPLANAFAAFQLAKPSGLG